MSDVYSSSFLFFFFFWAMLSRNGASNSIFFFEPVLNGDFCDSNSSASRAIYAFSSLMSTSSSVISN